MWALQPEGLACGMAPQAFSPVKESHQIGGVMLQDHLAACLAADCAPIGADTRLTPSGVDYLNVSTDSVSLFDVGVWCLFVALP